MQKACFILLFTLLLPLLLFASEYIVNEEYQLSLGQTQLRVKHQKLIHHSESVFADSLLLNPLTDYRIDYQAGILYFPQPPPSANLKISYLITPPELSKPRFSYQHQSLADSLKSFAPPRNTWELDSKLNISGSKTFALSFSETGETDLMQSLYVNLDGELSAGINIQAQLSDSQSKLSPEGDSKELSSLDQVFIRVYSRYWELGMGDLDLKFLPNRYLPYQSKLEGISARYDKQHIVSAAYSAGGGKSASLTLPIVEGKQGPYYLVANDYQRSFMVVAASELLYLNGRLLERGQDYYIDYSEGSVTFHRLLSTQDIITIYFQYTEENYRQNSYFSEAKLHLAPHLSLSHQLIHQIDDKSSPLLFSFSDSDLDSLRLAGDNEVYVSGVISSDSGSYRLISSPEGMDYYEYAPADSSAIYDIIFSYVGAGKGDYEEYSINKYRWVGAGLGSYLPLKRLVPATKRSNFALGLNYTHSGWQAAIDALYTANDRNTFSAIDDDDNQGGLFALNLGYKEAESAYFFDVLGEHRLPNSYRFSLESLPEHDFALLNKADSLAQSTVDIKGGFKSRYWNPELLLRYRDLDKHYHQKALRFGSLSPQIGVIFPATNLQSSFSLQEGEDAGFLQYHNLNLAWDYRSYFWQFAALLNQLEEESFSSTRYYQFEPALGIKGNSHFSRLSYKQEQSELKSGKWENLLSSNTYNLLHNSNLANHSIELDYSHKETLKPQETEPKHNYDLLKFRSSHNFLKNAFNFHNNFQLNQTEFYPKIRDLVYIGSGMGIYDSTGVEIPNGDYIYEYISASVGSLSSEINAISSFYYKPGLLFKQPFWQKLQGDISASINHQSEQQKSFSDALLKPLFDFGSEHSIYARQSLLQHLWLDIYQSRILSNLGLEYSRDLDKRYQTPERSEERLASLKLDFRGYYGINEGIEIQDEWRKESRYNSLVRYQALKSISEKYFSTSHSAQLGISAARERGSQQSDANQSYELLYLGMAPAFKSVLMQKYRITASGSLGYNLRSGTDFLNFLPQKRAGWQSEAQLLTIYRLNSFSSFSLEYRFNKYPKDKSKHNLKLEFKAEL
ncbi:MAG: hypothetical protein PHC50_03690 [Candidatus Cloacimonetes bacterium]|nr:hypothetical protein [Candidatus Cloacimonadota bacterium]